MLDSGNKPAIMLLVVYILTQNQGLCLFLFAIMYLYMRYKYTDKFSLKPYKREPNVVVELPSTSSAIHNTPNTVEPLLVETSDDKASSLLLRSKEKNAQSIRADINNEGWKKYYQEEFGESEWWDDDEYETSQRHVL